MVENLMSKVVQEVGKVVVGRQRETELLLVAFAARGHALLEGVPGVSKTMLAKAFSTCLGLEFRRVQFTPDMLPLDILGGFVFNMKTREFDFRRGPIFANVLLADEINRAPPKVQSALLESMQELQVTIEGHTERLPSPFTLIATQNPFEFEGVYPLPEGQLDRFMVKLSLDYPSDKVEPEVLKRNLSEIDIGALKKVASPDEIRNMFREVEAVKVTDDTLRYVAQIARETRSDSRIRLGASPRAMVHLVHCARAKAHLSGRNYVTPDDIKDLSLFVLPHRIMLEKLASYGTERPDLEAVVREVMDRVKPPR